MTKKEFTDRTGLTEIDDKRVGKINVMRLRKEAGWTLSPEDIDYLLDHCVEK